LWRCPAAGGGETVLVVVVVVVVVVVLQQYKSQSRAEQISAPVVVRKATRDSHNGHF
jgi:hypothetical protein